MAETTIATGIYMIENVDRRNDIFLADDGRGTLVAGSSEAGADPPWEARWKIIQLRNGRYFISPAAQQDQYASWPSNFNLRSAIVTGPMRNDWVVKEAREKDTFVISHVQHQLYWGIEDDSQGTPVRLRHAPTGSGNQWSFHRLSSSTTIIPQNVMEALNIEERVDCPTAPVPTWSQPRREVQGWPHRSTPVIPQGVDRSLAIDQSNFDSQMANTRNCIEISELDDDWPSTSRSTSVQPQNVVKSQNIDESLYFQAPTIPTQNQRREEVDDQPARSTPVVPQSVVESRTVADGPTASGPSQTRNANDDRPAIRHILEGHTYAVNSAAYSPDGERIVSGSADGMVRVWDVRTKRLSLEPIEGHTGWALSVAFSPDGMWIVSGSTDKTVRIWDAQSGAPSLTLNGHTDWVKSVACSPDSKRVVSGSWDKTVRVWDAETGRLILGPLSGHTNRVTSVNFSPDGERILSGSSDRTICVWDAETGHAIRTFHPGYRVFSATFSPDSKRIVSGGSGGYVGVWEIQSSDSIMLKGHKVSVYSVAFSPDGGRIVSGGEDRQIIVWDAKLGKAIGRLEGHSNEVNSVAFSLDGKWIISGSNDETVRIWEADRLDPNGTETIEHEIDQHHISVRYPPALAFPLPPSPVVFKRSELSTAM